MAQNRKGIVVLVCVVVLIGIVGYFVLSKKTSNLSVQPSQTNQQNTPSSQNSTKEAECAKLKDAIVARIDENNKSQKPETINDNNGEGAPENNVYLGNQEFKEVFYSPRADACLYLVVRRNLMKADSATTKNQELVWQDKKGGWVIANEDYYLVYASSDGIVNEDPEEAVETIRRTEKVTPRISVDDLVNLYKQASQAAK